MCRHIWYTTPLLIAEQAFEASRIGLANILDDAASWAHGIRVTIRHAVIVFDVTYSEECCGDCRKFSYEVTVGSNCLRGMKVLRLVAVLLWARLRDWLIVPSVSVRPLHSPPHFHPITLASLSQLHRVILYSASIDGTLCRDCIHIPAFHHEQDTPKVQCARQTGFFQWQLLITIIDAIQFVWMRKCCSPS